MEAAQRCGWRKSDCCGFPAFKIKNDPEGTAANRLSKDLQNPFYIGEQPGLTQTFGWADAWATQPSIYAPARRMWVVQWWKAHWPGMAFPNINRLFDYGLAHALQPVFEIGDRPEAGPNNAWWKGDAGQVGWFIGAMNRSG
jgi:hypothetical protein